MENEKSILDATEYILMAINNIKSYEEFLEYKEEIEKAVYDIRTCINNIQIKNHNNPKNIINNQKTQTSSQNNKKSISSMLGLKFNYDAYLDNFNINNLNQNINIDDVIVRNNKINSDYIEQNNKNENQNIDNIKYDNNVGFISFKDENNNFESQNNDDGKDNIIYSKSIRNKFKKSNNINNNKNEINTELNQNYKNDKINSNDKIDEKDLKIAASYKKEKINLIADIIMKINSEDYYYDILTKLFGNDLTDKLMSSDVSDELLEAVQTSIKEIDDYNKNGELNEAKNQGEINPEEIEEEPRKFPSNEIMGPNINLKEKSNKKINKELNNNNANVYQEFDFQKNLRKNDNTESGKKKGKNNNNSVKKEKPFVSATSAYGNYFDSPLQKGGISKLNDFKKLK